MEGVAPFIDRQESRCAKCQESGKAMCVVVGRGVKTVHYHCFACRHEWMHARVIPKDHIPFLRLVTVD